jgi:hypothetical protein
MGQNFSRYIEILSTEIINDISLVTIYTPFYCPERNVMALLVIFAYIDLTGISFCECVKIINKDVFSDIVRTSENNFDSFERFFMSEKNDYFYKLCFNYFWKHVFFG